MVAYPGDQQGPGRRVIDLEVLPYSLTRCQGDLLVPRQEQMLRLVGTIGLVKKMEEKHFEPY